MNPTLRVLVAIVATYGAGFVGSLFIDASVNSWYDGLIKPPYTPPNITFLVVWLVICALTTVSLIIIWTKRPETPDAEAWARFYFVQLVFNAAWTMFFFGFHALFLAFIDIITLLFAIICLVLNAFELDRRAAYLLLPYGAWVIFAAYLNAMLWYLN